MNPPLDDLPRILAPDRVLVAQEDLVPYAFDATAALRRTPRAVVFPASADEVAAVVRWAAAHRVPLVPRGSGTGLSGGSVAADDASVVVCLLRMNRILDLDPRNLTILVEPGVITQQIDDAAAAAGLFYPPDPGSMKVSTIGGNVANNAGGLRGLKYGVTQDYVMGVEVVTAAGAVAWLGGPCVKDVAGYSLRDLFTGSEGTLGILTRILLKLVPRPAARRTLMALFDRMEDAAETVSAIIAAPIVPCTLEFLDRRTLQCVEAYAHVGLPSDCEALLLMETDGHPAVVAEEADRMAAIARDRGARTVTLARDAQHAAELATARRSAFAALARLRPTTILEDVTVPRSRLAEMIRAVEAIAAKHRVEIGTFGHMGDGNLHPTFLTDERDAEAMRRVGAALDDLFAKTLELGGTITGEHGVGLAKKPYLPAQAKAEGLRLMRAVKDALDPLHILNPGKMFDPDDARA
jgi:glycolate oxidase